MRRDDLRQLVKSAGIRTAVETFRDLLEGEETENGHKEPALKLEDVSIRALYEAFVGDPHETLPSQRDELEWLDIKEEVNSSGFVASSRMLINAAVIKAYDGIKGIGDQLVTNAPSNTRHETYVGFTEAEGMKEVKESMPYEDSDIAEKYVTSDAIKKGRLVYVTEESIMEDRTGQLLLRAQRIGRNAAIDKEKTIIQGVLDINGNVYKPSGSATSLYSTANGNLMGTAGAVTGYTSAVPLTDWEDIDKVTIFYPLSIKDDRAMGVQEPIMWDPKILLVAPSKNATAKRIMNATEVRLTTNTNTRTIFNNPVAGLYTVLSSVYITNAADWYIGDFKEQFFWQDVWPIQTFTQGANAENGFLRDVVAAYKVRFLGGVGAWDTKSVVKVKGA
jgi:hypothetical protein